MQSLYDQFDFLPMWTKPPVVAFVTITIGYFVSIILAGFISSFFQKHKKDVEEGEPSFSSKLARFVFWASWTFFIGVGITQFPIAHNAVAKWNLSEPNNSAIIRIIVLSFIFYFSEDILLQLGSKIKSNWEKIPFPKSNMAIQKFLLITSIFLIATMISLTASKPQYISAAIFLLSIGFVLSKVIRETVSSCLDVFSTDKITQKDYHNSQCTL